MITQAQSMINKAKTRILTRGKSKELIRKNPVQARRIVEKVASSKEFHNILADKGVFDEKGKLDFDKLETVLKRDRKLRKAFYTKVGEEAKELGLALDGENTRKVGETVTKTGIRIGKTDEILRVTGLSITSADTYNKFLRLGDDLADKFAGGNYTKLVKEYTRNPAFREKVNTYLQEKVKYDSDLSVLNGINPNQTFSVIHSVKGATYTTRQALWDSKWEILKEGSKSFVSGLGQFTLTMMMYNILSQNMAVQGTINPYATQAMFPAMETASLLRRHNFLGGGYPTDYIAMENQRMMMQREGVTSV